jgi:hypothetical protein
MAHRTAATLTISPYEIRLMHTAHHQSRAERSEITKCHCSEKVRRQIPDRQPTIKERHTARRMTACYRRLCPHQLNIWRSTQSAFRRFFEVFLPHSSSNQVSKQQEASRIFMQHLSLTSDLEASPPSRNQSQVPQLQ